ncbi:MAG: hypothetical protein R3C26_00475 [Calditrichia bacterium]
MFGYWKQSADYCDKMIKGRNNRRLDNSPCCGCPNDSGFATTESTLNDLLKVGEKQYNSNKEGINVVGSDSDVLFDAAYEKVMSQSQVVEKSILKEVALNHEGMEVSYNFGNLSIIALSLLGIVFTIVFVVQLSNHIITPVKIWQRQQNSSPKAKMVCGFVSKTTTKSDFSEQASIIWQIISIN